MYRKCAFVSLTFSASILLEVSCGAEEPSRGDVSAGYSFLRLGSSGNGNEQGGSFSAAVNANRWFGIAGDFGVYSQSSVKTFTYLVGPRFSARNRSRATPYIEALLGGAHLTASGFGSTNAFAVLAGGGLELGMSRTVALRPQVDYLSLRSGGATLNGARVSLGVVFRFGSTRSQ